MNNKEGLSPSRLRWLIMISLLILMVIYVYSLEPKLKEASKSNELTYDKIVNNPEKFIGKDFEISGEISEMISRDNECSITLKVILTKEQSLRMSTDYDRNANNQTVTKLIYKTHSDNYMNFELNDRVIVKGKIIQVIQVNGLNIPVMSSDNKNDIEVI